MNKLEEFEKKLGSLALEIEAMKAEAEQDEGWPKYGDKYWASDSYTGKVFESVVADTQITQRRLAAGNVQRTREEAEAYRDWLTNPRTQARRRVEMCDGFDPLGHFCIMMNGLSGVIIRGDDEPEGGIRFTTKEQARVCIGLLGEDVIKLALGVES